MIVAALVSLITVLFLGGPAEIFYVDNLEKGVKKEIVEKERKKEILSDIKNTKAINKEYEKGRKQDYKAFLELYADKDVTANMLNSFFEELQESRTEYQNKLVDQRLVIFEKIESEEWDNILESSVTVSEKNIAKAEKKAAKSKEEFAKTKSKIQSAPVSEEEKQKLLKGLENLINSKEALESKVFTINASQNKILANKESSKEDLQLILNEDSQLREDLLESVTSLHELARENCSDDSWAPIMKSLTKEMQMGSR